MLIVCDTLRRIFSDSRPVDLLMLVIELLVLLLIAADLIAGVLHWHNKRSATARILVFLAEGQRLQDTPPRSQASDEEAKAWVEEVKNWILAVQSFLEKKCQTGCSCIQPPPHRCALQPEDFSLRRELVL